MRDSAIGSVLGRRPASSLASIAFIAVIGGGALGCSLPEPDGPPADVDCRVPAQNARLFNLMKDAYLWYRQVPDVDYEAYASPEALLSDLVYKGVDKWSYISKKAANDAYYKEGVSVGLGVRLRYKDDGSMYVGLVYAGSAADDAGLARGDRILALNGKTIAEIDAGELWDTILGPDEEGVQVAMQVERPGGATQDLTVTKGAYTITTTHTHKVLSAGGKKVGYLLLDRFLGTSNEELDNVFANFKESGVDELVLDLRYNGGGLIGAALHLGALIGGAGTEGKVFSHIVHNDRHTASNHDQVFDAPAASLGLSRVFFITTHSTASSSELLINGLRPHIDVKLIGGTTHGKPVGMGAWNDCDNVIHPISFRMLNAWNDGDFFQGIDADCAADDEVGRRFGDEAEASLAEALYVMRYGQCSMHAVDVAIKPSSAGARREVPQRDFAHNLGAF